MPSAQVLYLSVSEDFMDKIKSGEWKTDQKLPSERELAEQYGVGRSVIREALRVLSEKGLVRVVTGKGNYVTVPGSESLRNKMEEVLDSSRFKQKDIIDAREAIEMAIAKAAIEKATPEQIQALREVYDRMEAMLNDGAAFAAEDANFHLCIAECSQNEVLKMMTVTLNNVTDRAAFHQGQKNYDFSCRAQAEHKDMIDAIENKDLEKLQYTITLHMQCLRNSAVD